jgi:predicted dehydrogenase
VKYACDSTFDLNQVWNDPEVEAVFIATPTQTHFGIADRALEAGKHVFLEKPGTTSSADLEKLVNKAKEKRLSFAVGYEFPHHPAVKKLKELIAGKPLKSLHFEWQKWGTFKDSAIPHLL